MVTSQPRQSERENIQKVHAAGRCDFSAKRERQHYTRRVNATYFECVVCLNNLIYQTISSTRGGGQAKSDQPMNQTPNQPIELACVLVEDSMRTGQVGPHPQRRWTPMP